jgi:hypothetical protein
MDKKLAKLISYTDRYFIIIPINTINRSKLSISSLAVLYLDQNDEIQ